MKKSVYPDPIQQSCRRKIDNNINIIDAKLANTAASTYEIVSCVHIGSNFVVLYIVTVKLIVVVMMNMVST